MATSGLAVLFFSPNDAQSQGYHLGLQLAPNISMAEPRELSHEAIQSEAHFGYGFVFDAMFTDKYAIGTGVNVFYNGGITQHLAFQEEKNGLVMHAVLNDHVPRFTVHDRGVQGIPIAHLWF